METLEKKWKGRIIALVILLLLITIAAVGIALWSVFLRTPDPVLPPDYAPDDNEVHAEMIPGDDSEKEETPQGNGKVSLTFSNEVVVDLSDAKAYLMFSNPGRSSHDMILQVLVQNEVIVQSGLLKAGTQIKKLDMAEENLQRLKVGGYDGMFLLFYYDQTTGERAVVNTEIPVHISVRK